MSKEFVFLLNHTNPSNKDIKFIGIYSSRPAAEDAIKSLINKPGFQQSPDRFKIEEHELNRTWWMDGFLTWGEALDELDDE